jgi:hypothetical protein
LGQVVGVTTSDTTGYLWTASGGSEPISQYLPAEYENQVSNIGPIHISGTNASGQVQILFGAQYQSDANADPASGTFLLTLANGANPTMTGTVPGISGSSPNILQQVNLPSYAGPTILNAQGVIAGLATPPGGSGTGAFILPQTQLSLTGSTGGLWKEGGTTDANPSRLWAQPFGMKATAKAQPGVSGTVYIQQDGTATMTVTYTDGSTTSCATPGLLADYSNYGFTNSPSYGTDAQGNMFCEFQDQPNMPISTGVRPYISILVYSGSFRDFAVVGYGTAAPQVMAEVTWSFSESNTFRPDPNAPAGTGETADSHDYKCPTIPPVPGTVYGGPPTDQPIEPRDQSGNNSGLCT